MGKPIFKPLKSKRVFEEISDQIQEAICSRILKPGDKLPSERELSRQFNTGRMVVREAMRILEQSGFIFIKRGSDGGAFVKDVDTEVVTTSISHVIRRGNMSHENLTEVRLGIEMMMLDLAIQRITQRELELMKSNIESTERFHLKEMSTAESNINFHLLIARATKNPLLEMILESVMNVVLSFLEQRQSRTDKDFLVRHIDFHRKIYEAIAEKDLPKARRRMRSHILDVGKRFSEIKKGEGRESNTEEAYP